MAAAGADVLKILRVVRTIAFLRLRGVRFAGMPYLRGRLPRIDAAGEISLGRGFRMDGLQFRSELTAGPRGRLLIGDHVFVNRGCVLHASGLVSIGSHTRISNLVTILDTPFHEVEEGQPVRPSPVVIGRNVWIAIGAVVLPGVTIGDHAVIGAGTVVTDDVPARCLVAGNPGVVVRRDLAAADDWVRR